MSDIKHSLWVEKYRPTTLDTYIGNEGVFGKWGFTTPFIIW